jgi:uncharacterized protein (TIGR02246 family)
MKRIVIFFSVLLLLGTLGFSQQQKGKGKGKGGAQTSDLFAIKDAVKKMEQEIRDGQLKGDSSALEKYLADDSHTISGVSGQDYAKAQIIERLKSGKSRYSQINISEDDVAVFGPNSAISHGTADVKMTVDGKDASGKYHYARTWMKRGGKWQAVWFQSTKMP